MQLLQEFENQFSDDISNWKGNQNLFSSSNPMIETHLDLHLVKEYALPNDQIIKKLKDKYVSADSLETTVFRYAESLSKNQGNFKLQMIIGFMAEENQLNAKKIVLDFISKGLFIKFDPNEEKQEE